jgi:hypothetical protein
MTLPRPLTRRQRNYLAAFEAWLHTGNELAHELKDLDALDVIAEAGVLPNRRPDITGRPGPAGVHAQQPWQVLGPPRHWR